MKIIIVVLYSLFTFAKAFTTKYGWVPQSISPLKKVHRYEHGSGFLVPPSRSLAVKHLSITTSGYGIPTSPIKPITPFKPVVPFKPIAPLETIDLPEQGPGFLLPPKSRKGLQFSISSSDDKVPIAPIAPITTSEYGIPIAPVAPVKPIAPFKPIAPLETIDLPEQGPGVLLPPESRAANPQSAHSDYSVPIAPVAPITTSDYGIPIALVAPVKPIAPLETIDLPEQGPGVLLPPESRAAIPQSTNSDYFVPVAPTAPITTSGYGIPISPVAPVKPIAPLETIDLPEQGPGFLLPPESRAALTQSTSSDYSVPVAPTEPVIPVAPIETIDLPEDGAGFVLPPMIRSNSEILTLDSDFSVTPDESIKTKVASDMFEFKPIISNSDYGIPVAPVEPIAPLETIDLPEQGSGFLVPPTFRSGTQHSISNSDYSIPVAPIVPLETIDLPEQGPGLLVPPASRSGPTTTILSEQDPSIMVPESSRNGFQLSTINTGQLNADTPIAPLSTFEPLAKNAPLIPVAPPLSVIPIAKHTPPNSLSSVELNALSASVAPIAPEAPLTTPSRLEPFAPIEPTSQFAPVVTNDVLYSYQIRDGSSLRQETRETNGLTRGFYSYMDPNGILQRVDYVSDPLNGYKVLSEPMIKDTPEVAKAKADFFKAYQEALNVNLN